MELKNKKVLITGADGFIGSHLVEALINEGCDVRALVYYNSFNSWGWLDSIPEQSKSKIEVVAGDIRDAYFVKGITKGIDVIFHLAALIAIPFSYISPESYVDTNITGTLNILQAAKEEGVEKILVTSTSEVYGTALYVPIDEKHPRQGQSPYSATKIAADYMAESFYRSFGLPVTIVRPFNTFGPRQSARAVIPAVIIQLLNGAKEIALGDITPTRDFVFVKDTVRGFIEIAKTMSTNGQEINIATKSEITIGEMVQILISEINPGAIIKTDAQRLRPGNSEVKRLFGSNDKLKQLTGWAPVYTLQQGLKETIQWFADKENIKHYKSDIYNV